MAKAGDPDAAISKAGSGRPRPPPAARALKLPPSSPLTHPHPILNHIPAPSACLPACLQLILGQPTPLPVIASLVPIMLGVAMASAAELSFNWMGFLTAMMSNLTFGFRAVWSKK